MNETNTEPNVHIFHHIDNDGMAAAFWCSDFCENAEMEDYITLKAIMYHPINYGMEFPFDEINKDDIVFIVDFSLENPADLKKLYEEYTHKIIWIDHHITAIDKYADFEYSIPGIRYSGIAACVLTWYYLNTVNIIEFLNAGEGLGETKLLSPEMKNPAIMRSEIYDKCPMGTVHIGDRDIWQFDYPTTKAFTTAIGNLSMRSVADIAYTTDVCKLDMGDSGYDTLIYDGNIMLGYKSDADKKLMEFTYPVKLISDNETYSNYKCLALNTPMASSETFESIPDGEYDIFIKWYQSPNGYHYTLYSKNIDVSEICKSYGGGGHKGAAGCRSTDKLIFDWVIEE